MSSKSEKKVKGKEKKMTGLRTSPPYNNITKYSEDFKSTENMQKKLNEYILQKTQEINQTTNIYKQLNILANILKEIKEDFQTESKTRLVLSNKTNWDQYTDKPIYKILRYFRNQVIVRKYIKYSIEYITLLQLILTPDNLKKLQTDLDKFRNDKPVGLNNSQSNDDKYFKDIVHNIEKEYSNKSLREIIISMLNDYDINYEGNDSDRDLMMKLKIGLKQIMDFVVKSIESAPTALNMLEKLPIIDKINTNNDG